MMTSAQIIPFPQRGPFAVRVEREGEAWLVVCRDHAGCMVIAAKQFLMPSKSPAGSALKSGWRYEHRHRMDRTRPRHAD
jgi:hypothetical protein